MTVALVCGITGQDGAYLARSLLADGVEVIGTTRSLDDAKLGSLAALGIAGQVKLLALSPHDHAAARAIVADSGASEVYALWGQSSVGASFERPAETVNGIVGGTLALLEAVRAAGPSVRMFHAGSSESFGDLGGDAADEDTPLRPSSPYGAAKASAQMLISSYRASFATWAVSGILFNHESPLRPDHFVTRKITRAVARIAAGSSERLRLGDLSIGRDWGWAPDYVEAIRAMLRMETPVDLVLATGRTCTLQDFVSAAFSAAGLDWRDHVESDPRLLRPTDPAWVAARAERAADLIGWKASATMEDVATRMVNAERAGMR